MYLSHTNIRFFNKSFNCYKTISYECLKNSFKKSVFYFVVIKKRIIIFYLINLRSYEMKYAIVCDNIHISTVDTYKQALVIVENRIALDLVIRSVEIIILNKGAVLYSSLDNN